MNRFAHARNAALGLFLMAFSMSPAIAGAIDRVEPPFWWQGFEHRELQIVIHGQDISRFAVSVNYSGVSIDRVQRVQNKNYLFVYLDISAAAKPGEFDIVLEDGDFRVVQEYEL